MPEQTVRPDGRPVKLEELDFVLVSENLSAQVETFPGSAPGTRSGGQGFTTPMMRSAEIREMGTVVLKDLHPERDHDKSVDLYVPMGTPAEGRLLLYFDENGGVTFHVPQMDTSSPSRVRSARQMVRFEVPLRPSKEEKVPVRGIGGMIAKKVLKVIGWRVVKATARHVGPPLVRHWENKKRPTRALSWPDLFTPQAPSLESLIPPSDDQRSLLFIHGTFSRVASAFHGLDTNVNFRAEIHQRYGDRIYGFDHATLATGVATNVMQFYETLAPGKHNFDIICHSRGGLVARALRDLSESQLKERFLHDSERGQYEADLKSWGETWQIPDGVEVKVNCILFAGTPNKGTVLAQPNHLEKYLEILMTAANLLPELVDVTVDALLTVAKLLLSDVVPVLPGLDDQKPDSTLIPLLQPQPHSCDAAIQANYTPPLGLQVIIDNVADFIFDQQDNDLVVPTQGVSQWTGGQFPSDRLLDFPPQDNVHHSSLFLQKDTPSHILNWLMV